MDGIFILASELKNKKILGPNVVFKNIIQNLQNISLQDYQKELKFFLILDKEYKEILNIPSIVEEVFVLNSLGLFNIFLNLQNFIRKVLRKYKNIKLKILYPKPIFFPLRIEQYAFLHDLAFEKLFQKKTTKDLQKEYFFKKLIWKRLKKIFTVSFSSYQDIKGLLNLENLDWFHLGVDTNIFKIIDKNQNYLFLKDFFYKRGLSFVENYFFCPAGKVWFRKNVLNLVKAFKKFCQNVNENVFLIITANNLKDNNSYVKEVLSNSFERIIFLENLKTEEIVHLYNGCIAVIFPSFYEGFGLPILESLACGKNILFSNISVFKEIYPSNKYVFDPSDIEDIANCMLKFYIKKDYFLKERIIEKDIIKRFSWEKSTAKLIQKLLK